MSSNRCLMAVHAHPDDEVFSTGGILAKYAAEGHRVVVVYATRGEAGEMHDPDRDPDQAILKLGEIREEEARCAADILGITDVYFLGYRDSGMAGTEENTNPSAFANASLDEAAIRLMDIMRETRPQVVVTYNEDGGYGHPDHLMAHNVTVAAFDRSQGQAWAPQKLYFGASSREAFKRYVEGMKRLGLQIPWLREDFNLEEYGMPEAEITAHIDVAPFTPLKKAALAAHRTQIPADFFYLSIPDEALSDAAGVEYFVRARPPAEPGDRESDLFAGTKVRTAAA